MKDKTRKHILIISQAITQEYIDICAAAFGENCEIDVITGNEKISGHTVIHSPEHDASSLKSRLFCWIRYYKFMRKWMKSCQTDHYDLIFATSNPPINSYIGLKLKKYFHAPFIYMNWDIYPQIIGSAFSNPFVKLICNVWNSWNNRKYPEIDQMITIGKIVSESVNSSLKYPVDIQILPISVNTTRLRHIEKKNNPFSVKYGLTEKFVVLYSGKMGIGHNIELILKTASEMESYEEICFVFIGSGSKYPMVEQYIKRHNSRNIRLYPLQPQDVFPYSIACGDIGIVTQEASMAHLFMPSKTYSMMACGEAIIGIGTDHDDLTDLIRKNHIGEVVTDGSSEELKRKILSLYQNREKLHEYQRNARELAVNRFDTKIVEAQYRDLFQKYLQE